METLWNLYEERLNELNESFLHLLSEFEENHFLTKPEFSKYRLQYLGELIEKTLKSDQQQLILRLYAEIDKLRVENFELKSKCSELEAYENVHEIEKLDYLEFKQKCHSVGSTKVSQEIRKSCKKSQAAVQRSAEENDSFLNQCPPHFVGSTKFTKSKFTSTSTSSRNSQYSDSKRSRLTVESQNKIKASKLQKFKPDPEDETEEGLEEEIKKSCNFKYLKF